MQLIRILGMVLITILTSFYFFPFEFTFLPGINTKNIMAGIGLCLWGIQLAYKQGAKINRDFLQLTLWAGAVSLLCFLAVVINDTNDYTYVTYVLSMWIWVSAANLVVSLIKKLHKQASVELVVNYLAVVCVAQCLIALAFDLMPHFRYWVSWFYNIGIRQERLEGIGAGLDVAGSRFSAVLIMIVFQMAKTSISNPIRNVGLYLSAFIVISVIGNMISRTTTVGVVLGIMYLLYAKMQSSEAKPNFRKIFSLLIGILFLVIPLIVFEYQTNPLFQQHLRFGFEGFFSLIETGKWQVHSNDILKDMYVFPESLKTWFIGDGYLNDPYEFDTYYTGIDWKGYYQNTDVGYLRFIFYFGIFGLLTFGIYMYKVAKVCMKRFTNYRLMFLLTLLLNFAIWFKVSTDIFLVFALFLCISEEENNTYEQHILSDKSA